MLYGISSTYFRSFLNVLTLKNLDLSSFLFLDTLFFSTLLRHQLYVQHTVLNHQHNVCICFLIEQIQIFFIFPAETLGTLAVVFLVVLSFLIERDCSDLLSSVFCKLKSIISCHKDCGDKEVFCKFVGEISFAFCSLAMNYNSHVCLVKDMLYKLIDKHTQSILTFL